MITSYDRKLFYRLFERSIHFCKSTFGPLEQRARKERNQNSSELLALPETYLIPPNRFDPENMFSVKQARESKVTYPSQFRAGGGRAYRRLKGHRPPARRCDAYLEAIAGLDVSRNFPDEWIPLRISSEIRKDSPDYLR